MKIIGYVLMAIGAGLLLFLLINFLGEKNKIHSPIPEEEGIKVIQITPGK